MLGGGIGNRAQLIANQLFPLSLRETPSALSQRMYAWGSHLLLKVRHRLHFLADDFSHLLISRGIISMLGMDCFVSQHANNSETGISHGSIERSSCALLPRFVKI